MSDSVRPHRRQPTRLPRPWDSPGKNAGVGCHFLLQCMKVKSESRVRLFATPWTAAYQAPLSMGFSRQGKSTGVGCHCLLWQNSLERFNIDLSRHKISELEDWSTEIIYNLGNWNKKEKQNLTVFWDINKHTNINIIGVLKGDRQRKDYLKK